MDFKLLKVCVKLSFVHSVYTTDVLSDEGLSHEPNSSPSLSEFGAVSEGSPLVVPTHNQPRASPSPPPILHDLQQSDSTSYVLLNLAKGKGVT